MMFLMTILIFHFNIRKKMKYYIPTTSLNADNILSTESISPLSFYEKREFGYKTFEPINDTFPTFKECFVLFSQMPKYTIVDEVRESFPMIIEFDDELNLPIQQAGQFNGCNIFLCFDTIHLTPLNCKLLFFTDKARILTFSNCLDSQLNKLIDYFKFETIKSDMPTHNLDELLKEITFNQEIPSVVSRENQWDRLKGFIYGYCLGLSNNIPSEIAQLQSIQKRIYDVAATLARVGNNDKLRAELEELDRQYTALEPCVKIAQSEWEKYCSMNNLSCNDVNNLLRGINPRVESMVKKQFCESRNINLRPSLSDCYPDYKMYSATTERYTHNLIMQSKGNILETVEISKSIAVDADKLTTESISGDECELFNYIISKLLWSNSINANSLRTNRGEVAMEVGKTLGEFFGDDWQSHPARRYFVALFNNVTKYMNFTLNDSDSIVLKSVAAFVLKGEDYGELVKYLQNNSMPTYQYALALWGGVNGYVQISKSLLSNISSAALNNVYRSTYQLLMGKELAVNLEKRERSTYIIPQPITAIEDTNSEKVKPAEANWLQMVRDIVNGVFKFDFGNHKGVKDSLKQAIDANGNNLDKELFLKNLEKMDGWNQTRQKRDNAVMKRLKKELRDNNELEIGFEPCEFAYQYANGIANMLKTEFKLDYNTTSTLLRELEWGLAPKYSAGKNAEVLIEEFRKQLVMGQNTATSPNGRDITWKQKLYKQLDVDKIIAYLREKFL